MGVIEMFPSLDDSSYPAEIYFLNVISYLHLVVCVDEKKKHNKLKREVRKRKEKGGKKKENRRKTNII